MHYVISCLVQVSILVSRHLRDTQGLTRRITVFFLMIHVVHSLSYVRWAKFFLAYVFLSTNLHWSSGITFSCLFLTYVFSLTSCCLVTRTDAFVLMGVICCFVTSDPLQISTAYLSVIYICVEGAIPPVSSDARVRIPPLTTCFKMWFIDSYYMHGL